MNEVVECFLFAAPGPPSKPTLEIHTLTSLYLSWGEPEQPNGVIIGYNYTCYTTSNPSMVIQQEIGLDPSARNAIINGTGIDYYTIYTCEVTASTEPGEGMPALATAISVQAGKMISNRSIATCKELEQGNISAEYCVSVHNISQED